jgi:predicted nucleotidyltransferase
MDKLEKVLERIKKYNPEKVILFSSYGTDEEDESSDLDLVIIKNTRKRFLERLIEASRIISSDIDKVDIFIYIPAKWKRMIEWENPFAQKVIKKVIK